MSILEKTTRELLADGGRMSGDELRSAFEELGVPYSLAHGITEDETLRVVFAEMKKSGILDCVIEERKSDKHNIIVATPIYFLKDKR